MSNTGRNDLVTLTGVQELSHKTLVAPTIWADHADSNDTEFEGAWMASHNYRKHDYERLVGTYDAPVLNNHGQVNYIHETLGDMGYWAPTAREVDLTYEYPQSNFCVISNHATGGPGGTPITHGTYDASHVVAYHGMKLGGGLTYGISAYYGHMFDLRARTPVAVPPYNCMHGFPYDPAQRSGFVQPLTARMRLEETSNWNARALYVEATMDSTDSIAQITGMEITARQGPNMLVTTHDAPPPFNTGAGAPSEGTGWRNITCIAMETGREGVGTPTLEAARARWISSFMNLTSYDSTSTNGAARTGMYWGTNSVLNIGIDMKAIGLGTLPTLSVWRLPFMSGLSSDVSGHGGDLNMLKLDTGNVLKMYGALWQLAPPLASWEDTTAATQEFMVSNTNAGSAANARLTAKVSGDSAGDPHTLYTIAGQMSLATGLDNSAGAGTSNPYKITAGSVPGDSGGTDWLILSPGSSGGLNLVTGAYLHKQIATPSTPASGTTGLYSKSDDRWYQLSDGGVESKLALSSELYTNPLTTQGDLLYGGVAGVQTRLAVGGAKALLGSTGTIPAWLTSVDISGSGTFETGLNVGSATAAATGEIKTSAAIRPGSGVYPGNAGTAQAHHAYRGIYPDTSIPGNSSVTVSSFPMGHFVLINRSSSSVGTFLSNGAALLTDVKSDASVVYTGDPGASTSKIGMSMTGGTLTIWNRYATAQFVGITGLGAE